MTLDSDFIALNNLPGSSFKSSHPVNFSLFDQNNHYALYIDDSNALGQPLIFEVHNRSDRAITFVNEQGEIASATNYHFELQFRSEVLSSNTMGKLQDPAQRGEIFNDTANWDIFTSGQADGVDHISLYLLHKGDSQWEPHSKRSLRFNGVNASAVGGARGTQVMMLTNQLAFADSSAPLTGQRRHHMSIINYRGTKNIPLHVAFKGSNQVLNSNGALSNLTLQVVNNLRLAQTHADIPAIMLNAAPPGQPFSRFVLEFDVQQEGEMKAWALARADELGELTVTAYIIRRGKEKADDTVTLKVTALAAGQSLSRQWEIAPTENIVLNPLDTIEINLSGIVTSLPTGSTNLYLHYDNISGYQDGRFVVPILKSPLMFAGGNVGIGTSDPRQKLDVAGNIVGANLSVARTNTSRGALFLATSGDFNHALYNNYSNVDGEGAQDSAKWNVFDGLNIRTGSGTQKKTALAIDGKGNVGIGPVYPDAKLTINSDEGLALRVEPAAYKSVHIGRSAYNGLEFDSGAGTALNSTANISLNIDTNGTESNNERYIDFRANGNGFSGGSSLMRIRENGQVDIGTTNYAVPSNFMAAGSLTIGNYNQNYGGGTAGWSSNTAGLMLECDKNTEIAAHDANTRVASLMYYEGDAKNLITIGRNMGWGTTNVHISGHLAVEGGYSQKFKRWWTLGIPDDMDWGNTRIGLFQNAQWSNSDARLKTNIKPISNALDKISQLKGVTYKWNTEGLQYLTSDIDTYIFAGPDATEESNQKTRAKARIEAYKLLAGTEVGLLAQDVEQVLPEMVRTNDAGYKSIRYELMTALLVEAVKELSALLRS